MFWLRSPGPYYIRAEKPMWELSRTPPSGHPPPALLKSNAIPLPNEKKPLLICENIKSKAINYQLSGHQPSLLKSNAIPNEKKPLLICENIKYKAINYQLFGHQPSLLKSNAIPNEKICERATCEQWLKNKNIKRSTINHTITTSVKSNAIPPNKKGHRTRGG